MLILIKKRTLPGLIGLFDLNKNMPYELNKFLNTSMHINSSLNPLFYYFFNSLIREGYLNVFSKLTKKIDGAK